MALEKLNAIRNDNRTFLTAPFTFNLRPIFTDEEFADECAEKSKNDEKRQLDSLKEDLAQWLNRSLHINNINGENFLSELDNGVTLCHLAQIICNNAQSFANIVPNSDALPKIGKKCFEKAKRRSFFSRDNMENFIKFCRTLGVHENLLFESDDLVLHNKPRNVILCLLEVARLASGYGLEPPSLVHFRKEIVSEEYGQNSDVPVLLSWQFPPSTKQFVIGSTALNDSTSPNTTSSNSASMTSTCSNWNTGLNTVLLPLPYEESKLTSLTSVTVIGSDGVPSDHTEDDWSRDSEDPEKDANADVITELDKKILQVTNLMRRTCNCSTDTCSKLSIRKISEGKYNINGKKVFVRLLKGSRMMVRVGGGWDYLDNFLLRHDPCRTKPKLKISVLKPEIKIHPTVQHKETLGNATGFRRKFTYYRKFGSIQPLKETTV